MTFTSPTFRRAFTLAASCTLFAAFAVPAAAKDVESRPATAAAGDSQAAAAAPARKICTVESFTSTRMPRKICKTEREWANEGVEISRK